MRPSWRRLQAYVPPSSLSHTHIANHLAGQQFGLESRDLMIVSSMKAIADGSSPTSSLPSSTQYRARAVCIVLTMQPQESWICSRSSFTGALTLLRPWAVRQAPGNRKSSSGCPPSFSTASTQQNSLMILHNALPLTPCTSKKQTIRQ